MTMTPLQLGDKIRRFFQPSLPPVGVEIARDFVAAVRLNPKDPTRVERSAITPLPSGLVNPSLSQPNISSPEDLTTVVKSILAKTEIKTGRISLAVPDSSVKVAIHQLDKLPGSENEKQQLLRWRLKKTTPFNVEDAHLSYVSQPGPDGKLNVLTVIIFREVLEQYERLFQGLGIQAGFITSASVAALELLPRTEAGSIPKSTLIVRSSPFSLTAMIIHLGTIVFFRHLDYFEEAQVDGAVPRVLESSGGEIRNLYEEIHPCLMYYQDKLGTAGVDRIWILAPQDLQPEELELLSRQSGAAVSNLNPLQSFRSYPPGSLPVLKSLLAPSLGLAMGSF